MSFITDQQTLTDLSIFSKSGKPSIYAFFNQTAYDRGRGIIGTDVPRPLSNRISIAGALYSGIPPAPEAAAAIPAGMV